MYIALQTIALFCHMSPCENPTISCLTDQRKMLLRKINTRGKEFYKENIRNVQNYVTNYIHYHKRRTLLDDHTTDQSRGLQGT